MSASPKEKIRAMKGKVKKDTSALNALAVTSVRRGRACYQAGRCKKMTAHLSASLFTFRVILGMLLSLCGPLFFHEIRIL